MKKSFVLLATSALLLAGCNETPQPCQHENVAYRATDSDEYHEKYCADCDLFITSESHEFGEWVIDTQAELFHPGTRHKTCSVCNYSKTGTYFDERYFDEINRRFVDDGDGILQAHLNDDTYSFEQGGYYTLDRGSAPLATSREEGVAVLDNMYDGIPLIKYGSKNYHCPVGNENTKRIVIKEGVEEAYIANRNVQEIVIPKSLKRLDFDGQISDFYFDMTIEEFVKKGGSKPLLTEEDDELTSGKLYTYGVANCYPYGKISYFSILQERFGSAYVEEGDEYAHYTNQYFKNDQDEWYIPVNVELSEEITEIPDYCFCNIQSLKSLKAPGVTKIGDFAFAFINYLATVEFSEIKEIGKFAFERCHALRKGITFSSECKEIPQGAFEDCYNIRGIELKEGLEKIGDYAFSNTYHLYKMIIPASVTELGDNPFNRDKQWDEEDVLEVYVADGSPFAGNEHYLPMTHESQIKIYDNDVVVSGNYILGCENSTSIKAIITNCGNATCVSHYAFAYLEELYSISLPEGVYDLESNAFRGCIRLMQVALHGVNQYNYVYGTQDTFRNCFALQEIFINEDADYQQLSCSGVDVHIIKGHNKESKIYTISDGVDTIYLYNTEHIVNGDTYELGNASDGYEFLAIRSTHTNTTKSINFDDWRDEGKTYFTAHPLGTMLGVAKSPVQDEKVYHIALSNKFDMYCTHIEEVTLNANISSFGYADKNNHWENSSCPFMLACALNLKQVKWSSVNYKASELDFIEDNNGARVLLGLDNE